MSHPTTTRCPSEEPTSEPDDQFQTASEESDIDEIGAQDRATSRPSNAESQPRRKRTHDEAHRGTTLNTIMKALVHRIGRYHKLSPKKSIRYQMAVIFTGRGGVVRSFGSLLIRRAMQRVLLKKAIVESTDWEDASIVDSEEIEEDIRDTLPVCTVPIRQANVKQLLNFLRTTMVTLNAGVQFVYSSRDRPDYWPENVDFVNPSDVRNFVMAKSHFPDHSRILRFIIRHIFWKMGRFDNLLDGDAPNAAAGLMDRDGEVPASRLNARPICADAAVQTHISHRPGSPSQVPAATTIGPTSPLVMTAENGINGDDEMNIPYDEGFRPPTDDQPTSPVSAEEERQRQVEMECQREMEMESESSRSLEEERRRLQEVQKGIRTRSVRIGTPIQEIVQSPSEPPPPDQLETNQEYQHLLDVDHEYQRQVEEYQREAARHLPFDEGTTQGTPMRLPNGFADEIAHDVGGSLQQSNNDVFSPEANGTPEFIIPPSQSPAVGDFSPTNDDRRYEAATGPRQQPAARARGRTKRMHGRGGRQGPPEKRGRDTAETDENQNDHGSVATSTAPAPTAAALAPTAAAPAPTAAAPAVATSPCVLNDRDTNNTRPKQGDKNQNVRSSVRTRRPKQHLGFVASGKKFTGQPASVIDTYLVQSNERGAQVPDDIIALFGQHAHVQFPEFPQMLTPTELALSSSPECISTSRPSPIDPAVKYVQIHLVDGHWVVSAHLPHLGDRIVRIYDSQPTNRFARIRREPLRSQLINLYSNLQDAKGIIRCEVFDLKGQLGQACGYYAMAYVTDVLFDGLPETRQYNQKDYFADEMRDHARVCLESGLQRYPGKEVSKASSRAVNLSVAKCCFSQRESDWVQCPTCLDWFHQDCFPELNIKTFKCTPCTKAFSSS